MYIQKSASSLSPNIVRYSELIRSETKNDLIFSQKYVYLAMADSLITVQNLSWAPPGSDTPIFSDVSFELARGERVTLVGRSGSGKSTLLRCMVGLEPRLDGEVFWRGEPVGGESMRGFRNRVVYVHQRPSPVAETVGENLEFARQMAAEFEESASAMSQSDQRNLCDRIGLENMDFSRRFDDLSVGEQQRVCLVRTLTSRPDLLLLDEPTSALDPQRVEQIEQMLCNYVDEAPGARGFLWVSHQPNQIQRVATRSIDLESGRDHP
jgi:putative ABC transport system ATP-binding protein